MFKALSPIHWKDYELIDAGRQYKLERFGNFVLSRPEPQAVWAPSLSEDVWQKKAHAHFERDKNNPEKGVWRTQKGMPDQWKIQYAYGDMQLVFRLGMTAFKHIGIFPEQAENWDFIYDQVKRIKPLQTAAPKVLNLFAYTGGASLAARAAGAEVTHVDSVKQVVNWSNENMQYSRLDNIRWVVEDALKFAKREVRRGNVYQGIILDPPAYGRGADGEKWVLESNIDELIGICASLLDKQQHFFILNLYSMGLSPLIAETLLFTHFGKVASPQFGELYIEDSFEKKLPLGIFYRFAQ